jgi:hypothetical protein
LIAGLALIFILLSVSLTVSLLKLKSEKRFKQVDVFMHAFADKMQLFCIHQRYVLEILNSAGL